MKKFNRSNDRASRLRSEEKSEVLNKSQHFDATLRFNNFFDMVKSDYHVKDKQSQVSASKVVLTA